MNNLDRKTNLSFAAEFGLLALAMSLQAWVAVALYLRSNRSALYLVGSACGLLVCLYVAARSGWEAFKCLREAFRHD